MPTGEIQSIAVIGAGTMGAQIATLAAFSGRQVHLFDMAPDALERAETRIEADIIPSISEHGPIHSDAADVRARLTYVKSLEEAVSGVDLVIEAVREELETKRTVFADLSRLAPNAILATNS